MITAYHRPQSLDEALGLITRKEPRTYPLGGGTLLVHGAGADIEVVDLQSLGLNRIDTSGKVLEIGASVSLQDLLVNAITPAALRLALKLEAPLNIRNSATAAGTVVASDGRSAFTTTLLALDTRVVLRKPTAETVNLGDFLPLRSQFIPGSLITGFELPMNAELAFEYVSRTPADKPIVCAALARWPSGRTRLAVGGYGASPLVAMDGTEAAGIEAAARNAFHDAADPWGSAEYRMEVAGMLARRCLESVAAA